MLDANLYAFAQQTYYSRNTFLIKRCQYRTPSGWSPHVFTYPNPGVAHWVRKVTLKLHVAFPDFTLRDTRHPFDRSDWRFLLREGPADWHDHFQLEELLVVVAPLHAKCNVGPHNRTAGWVGGVKGLREPLQMMFGTLKPSITAKKVEVEVDGFECADDEQGVSKCGNDCSRALKEEVEALFEKE